MTPISDWEAALALVVMFANGYWWGRFVRRRRRSGASTEHKSKVAPLMSEREIHVWFDGFAAGCKEDV